MFNTKRMLFRHKVKNTADLYSFFKLFSLKRLREINFTRFKSSVATASEAMIFCFATLKKIKLLKTRLAKNVNTS